MIKKILKGIALLLAVIVLLAAGLLCYLFITEFRPADRADVAVEGSASGTLRAGEAVTVLTWNVGYGALGDNADFFMDGGRGVYTADAERVQSNLEGIAAEIRRQAPDLLLLQEVDRDSARSRHVDEMPVLAQAMPGSAASFANNFKVAFLPFPIPPIGQVDSGLLSFSVYPVREAERIQLPIPFDWPVRMAYLKRCLLVQRIPLADGTRELVLINLHLEAYDDGEGKAAQTLMLQEILEREAAEGNYVIAGGDFNQIFSNADTGAYPAQEGKWQAGEIDTSVFPAGWQTVMDAAVPSCRSLDQPYVGADRDSFQYYLIDGFVFSENITLRHLETLDLGFVCSDHNPVRAEILLEP